MTNEKDPGKSRGFYCSILYARPVSTRKKWFSNHTISSWTVFCKPLPLILFSSAKMDANTLFALFNYCNPVAERLSQDNIAWHLTVCWIYHWNDRNAQVTNRLQNHVIPSTSCSNESQKVYQSNKPVYDWQTL